MRWERAVIEILAFLFLVSLALSLSPGLAGSPPGHPGSEARPPPASRPGPVSS